MAGKGREKRGLVPLFDYKDDLEVVCLTCFSTLAVLGEGGWVIFGIWTSSLLLCIPSEILAY